MENLVGIAGYAQLKNERGASLPRERMYYELAKKIYETLNITRDDVDTFIFSSNDFIDGRTISEVYLVQRVGSYMKDETKTECESLNAVIYGVMRILSGNYRTALIISASRSFSDFKPYLIQNQTLDPVYERPRGLLNFISGLALQAREYCRKYKIKEEIFDMYAKKNLELASRNPISHLYGKNIEDAEIKNSPYLYEPIRERYLPDYVDGGCAVLLADEKTMKKLTKNPVWIKGFGYAVDSYYIGDRDIVNLNSLRKAAKMAYRMAGIRKPSKGICFAELYENSCTEEVVLQEALGLFEEGSGEKVIKDGLSKGNGGVFVNPSGGTFAGNPLNVAGLQMLVEAVKELRGEKNVVKNPKTALVHSQDGVCAQLNAVIILGV